MPTDQPHDPDALHSLLAAYPDGFTVAKDGRLTPAASVTITSLDQLSQLSRASKEFQFDVHGTTVRLEIHPLLDAENAEIEKIGSEITPPPRFSDREKKVVTGYDRSDPDYVKKMSHVFELRRAARIARGIPLLGVPVGTAEQQLEHITKNLPSHIIDALGAAVAALSTDPIEKAAFI